MKPFYIANVAFSAEHDTMYKTKFNITVPFCYYVLYSKKTKKKTKPPHTSREAIQTVFSKTYIKSKEHFIYIKDKL